VAYCKPHISTEYHSNTKIFQNHLSLAFQYFHHICYGIHIFVQTTLLLRCILQQHSSSYQT
jgi:hypothetical protein